MAEGRIEFQRVSSWINPACSAIGTNTAGRICPCSGGSSAERLELFQFSVLHGEDRLQEQLHLVAGDRFLQVL